MHVDRRDSRDADSDSSWRRQIASRGNLDRVSTLPIHILLQAIVGRHRLDLDLGGVLHEHPCSSGRHVFPDAEHRQSDCEPILPDLPNRKTNSRP